MAINYNNNVKNPRKRNNTSNKISLSHKVKVNDNIKITCFGCRKKGHYKSECPERSKKQCTVKKQESATTHRTSNKYEESHFLHIEYGHLC